MFHHIGIIRQEGYFRTKLSCSIGTATIVFGSALAGDRVERRRRDPRPEQPRVMRAYRHGLVHVLRPGPEASLLGELETGVLTLAHTVLERHPRRFLHVCRHPCRK